MTDMTTHTEAIRPERAAGVVERLHHAPPRREYYAYFGLIFIAALPLCLLTWILSAARRLSLPEKGPIARAWTQARIITPMIFSA